MTAKQKKLFLLTSMMSVFVMAVAVLFAGGNVVNPLKRVFASQQSVVQGTITFNSGTTPSGSTNITYGETQGTQTRVICKITGNDTSYSSGHVGAVKAGAEMHFYESDGVTEYLLEDMDKISMSFANTVSGSIKSPDFTLCGFYDDGRTFNLDKTGNSNATRTLSFTGAGYGNVSRIYVVFSGSTTYYLNSVVLTYNCTPKYQTGVEITTGPDKTTYSVGQSFDPTGMIVKATYSNSTSIATDRYTVSPSGPLTIDDTYVTITSGGFSVTQAIIVTDAASHAVGTYRGSLTMGVYIYLTLNSDGTGVNSCDDNGECAFTWSFNGTTLSFYSDKNYTFYGSLFASATSINASNLTYNSNDINTFRASVNTNLGASTKTFTRQ